MVRGYLHYFQGQSEELVRPAGRDFRDAAWGASHTSTFPPECLRLPLSCPSLFFSLCCGRSNCKAIYVSTKWVIFGLKVLQLQSSRLKAVLQLQRLSSAGNSSPEKQLKGKETRVFVWTSRETEWEGVDLLQPSSGFVETAKTSICKGNFTWHLAMVIWGPIILALLIRVSNFPAEIIPAKQSSYLSGP